MVSIDESMNAAEAAAQPMQQSTSWTTFFRQSGWMVFATLTGGMFFYAVHIFASRGMPKDEYGVFNALLQVLNQMAIPSAGLQTIFVQEAALAQSEQHRRELTGAVRAVFRATFFLWLATAALVLLFQSKILHDYKINNPVALWATVAIGLLSLWTPITNGIMMGRQNFLWVGIASMSTAFVRLIFVAAIVLLLGGYAAGAMIAVLIGLLNSFGLGIWQTHQFWRGEAERFVWTPWLKRIVPLTLGTGALTFVYTIDMLAVQRFLTDTGTYGAAGMIGRALMFLVAPMTTVMFPKIVQSAAKAERTDVLAQALGATALLAGASALFATFFAKIPILIVQGPDYLAAAKLVPWFTWCILPLTVSGVLVNNLLARQRYAVVPWLVLVAAIYGFVLWQPAFHASHLRVIQTLGVFALLFFGVCVWFTWSKRSRQAAR
jgi:O-antigen/teichoic acid export membrane protein